MRFKEFMEAGLFGDVKKIGIGANTIPKAKHPSASISTGMGPKVTKPARPAGIFSFNKPNTLVSNFG